MKVIGTVDEGLVFGLSGQEKLTLLALLERYPSTHSRAPKLTRSSAGEKLAEAQKLLEDSITSQKLQNQKQLAELLAEKSRFIESAEGFQISLKHGEMEWLLQVLNDIRVGAWTALGAPDLEFGRELRITTENAPSAWAMELAGYFEMVLLQAINPAQ